MLGIIILKSIFVYFLIMFALKFMGKREIGQISLFDLSIILIIANIVVIGIEESDHPFYYYIIPIIVLSIIQKTIAFLVLKNNFLRKLIDGKESIIIYEGKINIKEMKRINYNMDDLIVQLRLKNVYDLSNIRFCIIEANGQLSVIYNEIKNEYVNTYPFGLIISGKIIKENLNYCKVDYKWLIDKLEKKGIYEKNIKDLIYCSRKGDDIFLLESIDLNK